MKTEINPPSSSKITWTSQIAVILNAIIGLMVVWEWLSADAAVYVGVIANALLMLLINIFRRFYTVPKHDAGRSP